MIRKRITPLPRDLENRLFDVVIIGAGINGTGISRDCASRGLKTLLLDKGDLVEGTSSRSGRMIHGGLRYLQHYDLGLVWEALRERKTLLRIAPHLVKVRPLLIPLYKRNKHARWMVRIGLMTLDFLSLLSSAWIGHHRFLSRQETLKTVPAFNPQDLLGSAIMPDAYADYAERLCIENTIAACDHGAEVVTHAKVQNLQIDEGRVTGLRFWDLLEEREVQVQSKIVINAAGPWVDRVLGNEQEEDRLVGGTKGSFLIVDAFEGAPKDSCYYEALEDGRPVVLLPWNGRLLIGTTDLRYDHDPGEAVATQAEIDYLIKETNRAFPTAAITPKSILFSYAGVRPLPRVRSDSTGAITRRHIVHDHAPAIENLISVLGGKLSTFRSLAEETVNRVFQKLERSSPRCTTASPLPGAQGVMSDSDSLPAASVTRIRKIYGNRSRELEALIRDNPALKEVFDPSTGAIAAELILGFQQEHAETLTDLLLRRCMVGYDSIFDRSTARKAADIAAKHFGWDEERREYELDEYKKQMTQFQVRNLT